MSSQNSLRQLSFLNGEDMLGARALVVFLVVVVLVLMVYGTFQSKRARDIMRQRRESTADTVVVEIMTPKSPLSTVDVYVSSDASTTEVETPKAFVV
ncbi:Aste57867_4708 [Aphanomyces stellatus]|uniref:Aste57867_4708 protein n=1 Tax=Aphanomyces stellatus TaxID=120398 RepID=A0A485KBT1_9STRA|nr:hypothetical protein As57867_004695 [Aphanomyces stellatus]VFT81808.1 Aste57867_4708 [Aphanomyces stellatus]